MIFSVWNVWLLLLLLLSLSLIMTPSYAAVSNDRSLIVGGTIVSNGDQYPYFTHITIEPPADSAASFICGGVLIHSDIVLTAAQCYIPNSVVTLRMNASNQNDGIERTAVQLRPHEDYDNNFPNDIMLIQLNLPILPTEIMPIAFDDNNDVVAGDRVTIMGFGSTSEQEREQAPSPVLREVEQTIGNFALCNQQYGFELEEEKHLCTVNSLLGGADSCDSDGGGPLLDTDSGSLVGIISFGIGCGRPLSFSGYTKIAPFYTQWIQDHICELSTFSPPYCPERPMFCVSGTSTVQVEGGSSIPLSQVQIGDRVLVSSEKDGEKYEPIYSFGHYDPTATGGNYLQITVDDDKTSSSTLQLSKNHMVFLDTTTNHNNPDRVLPASKLRIGDRLVLSLDDTTTTTNNNNNNTNGIITDIQPVVSSSIIGAYAPFTPSGKLYVNGILTSSYVALFDNDDTATALLPASFHHWIAHASQFPHRIMCHYFGNRCNTYDMDGISTQISFYHFTVWMLQQISIIQYSLLFFGSILALFFHLLELYPIQSCLLIAVVVLLRKSGGQIKIKTV